MIFEITCAGVSSPGPEPGSATSARARISPPPPIAGTANLVPPMSTARTVTAVPR
ncbi:hypothetical protein [Streptosporangium roseum]|uniref:hypothetical protein n=1 Tax=Streptosporangium roseum TaxID=2001 RepID=UPI003328471A